MQRFRTLTMLTLTLCAAATSAALAGELEPPGPPAPTMKTLVDVEPRTMIRNDFDTLTPIVITEPGSYYLAEDIYAFPNAHGIEIRASHVTLDLNGFSVIGNVEVGSFQGIYARPLTGFLEGLVIRNGTVRHFFGDGVDLVLSKYALIENVHALHNGLDGSGHGIRADTARIKDSFAVGHPDQGIGGAGNVVTGCISAENNTGITARVVNSSYAIGNDNEGIRVASNGVVANSSAVANGGDGIEATNSLVIGNATDGLGVVGSTTLHNEVN